MKLSLTTAVIFGDTMMFASDMTFWEERKYKKMFEKNILEKLKKELGLN